METCKKKLKAILKRVDYFGTFLTFRVNEEIEYKSIIGGTFSILYAIIVILYITTMSLDFIQRKNLSFIYSTKITQDPYINLSDIHFNFAFGIQFSKTATSAIKETRKFFDYNVSIVEYFSNEYIVGKENIIYREIKTRRCTEDDFPELLTHFYLNDLGDMICPIVDSTSNFSIEGLYTDSYYKTISIKLSLSQYSIDNYQELADYLNGTPIEFALFYKDTAIDYENRKNPLPSFLNYYYKGIDIDFIKYTEIDLSKLEFKNDENLIFEGNKLTIKATHFSSRDLFRYVYSRLQDKEYSICEYIIKSSSTILQLKRTYEKLPEFAANISGIISFIFFVMILVANIIEIKIIDQKLIHKMLKFRGNKNIDVNYFVEKFNHHFQNDFTSNLVGINEKGNLKYNSVDFNNKKKENKENLRNIKIRKINSFFEGLNNINCESIPNKIEKYEEKNETKIENVEMEENEENEENNNNNTSYEEKNSSKNSQRVLKNKFKTVKTCDLEKEVFKSSEMRKIKQTEIKIQSPNSKKNQEDLVKLSLCQIVRNFLCFWCNKSWKRKNLLIQSAEKKINYYMDIITYVKTIQEFELLKEMIFNESTLRLFQFVSKPTMKIMEDNFIFCHHFLKDYIPFRNIGKEEIDELYKNYKEVLQEEKSEEKLKLLSFIKGEINFLVS